MNPTHVQYASEQLKGTDVLVCTVIGFPLGATTTAVKSYETKDAINNGAQEIDMVINIGALKDGRFDKVQNDIEAVVQAANGKTVKVIIETVLLTEKRRLKHVNYLKRQVHILLKHPQVLLVGVQQLKM